MHNLDRGSMETLEFLPVNQCNITISLSNDPTVIRLISKKKYAVRLSLLINYVVSWVDNQLDCRSSIRTNSFTQLLLRREKS